MSHAVHEGPHRVLADNCDECVTRSHRGIDGLLSLDHENLRKLFELAAEMEGGRDKPDNASYSDVIIVRSIQKAAMVFERAGANEVDIRRAARG